MGFKVEIDETLHVVLERGAVSVVFKHCSDGHDTTETAELSMEAIVALLAEVQSWIPKVSYPSPTYDNLRPVNRANEYASRERLYTEHALAECRDDWSSQIKVDGTPAVVPPSNLCGQTANDNCKGCSC